MYLKNNKKGVSLIIVILVLTTLMGVSGIFVPMVVTEIKQAQIHNNQIQAYYLARSGVERAQTLLAYSDHFDGNMIDGFNTDQFIKSFYGNLNEPFTEGDETNHPIVFTIELNNDTLTIESTGTIRESSETVTLELTKSQQGLSSAFDKALFAVGQGNSSNPAIELTGSSSIIGPAGTNSTGDDSVQFGWSTEIDGNFSIGTGSQPADVIHSDVGYSNGDAPPEYYDPSLPDWHWFSSGAFWQNITDEVTTDSRTYSEPDFPDFPDDLPQRDDFTTPWVEGTYYEINQNGEYNLIQASSGRTITIDLDGGNRILRVNNLDISTGNINLINTGSDSKLILYVENSFTLSGDSTINENGNIGEVIMYYQGNSEPNIGGNTRFVGSLFAESADISINGSNGVTGHIITGGDEIDINGDASLNTRILYAPNANVNLGGSGQIKGSLIADRFSGYGNAKIIYDTPDFDTFPEGIIPGFGSGGGSGSGGSISDNWGSPIWSY